MTSRFAGHLVFLDTSAWEKFLTQVSNAAWFVLIGSGALNRMRGVTVDSVVTGKEY